MELIRSHGFGKVVPISWDRNIGLENPGYPRIHPLVDIGGGNSIWLVNQVPGTPFGLAVEIVENYEPTGLYPVVIG
jgi:hypothetical protein